MRAQSQSFSRNVTFGFAHAPPQNLQGLEIRLFGGYQSQHYELIVRHVAERLQGAGPDIVIFQQQPVRLQLTKELAADRLIPALRQPPAALIAASDMEPESDSRKTGHHGVVQLDAKR